MKNTISSALICIALLSLFSCGPKRPSTEQVDAFMESLSLRMNMTKDNYMRFVNTLPEKSDMMSGTMTTTTHEFISKEMKKERELAEQCKPFEADEAAKAKSEALKKAAIDVIDTYIDGAAHELEEVRIAISKGKTKQSSEVTDLLGKFETRLNAKYDAYGKIQADLARDFGISLY